MFRAVSHSPAALQAIWGFFGALGGGTLPAKLGERIAVAVTDRNRCNYCLAAHTALGRKAGASALEMAEAQAGRSSDPPTAAALVFALKVEDRRADVSDADVQGLRDAGFSDEATVEILTHVALNRMALTCERTHPGKSRDPVLLKLCYWPEVLDSGLRRNDDRLALALAQVSAIRL